MKQNATVKEQIPERDEENEGPISQLGDICPEAVESTSPQTRDTRAKAAGTNAKYIDLANKDDLAKIGAEKMADAGKAGRDKQLGGLSQIDKPPEPKHDTRATIAKAANTSTGMVGMAHRLKASRTFYR